MPASRPRWRTGWFLSALSPVLLAACALGPLSTPHTPAERASIDQAQSTLDGLHGLTAQFLQLGPNGGTASGTAWFEPGHLRLEYRSPQRRLVVAGDGRLVVRDAATDATTRISLSANPLGLLLAGPIRLDGAIDVTDIQRSATGLQLSLTRASNPAQGLLTLFFAVRPDGSLLLSGLEAVDAERQRTRFRLYGEQLGAGFAPSLFTLPG